MKFTIVEHEDKKGLAYKWLGQCDEGCCEIFGIEMKAVFGNEYVSMFIETQSETDLDGLIEGKHEKYIGALNEIFSLWMEHLKEEGLGESNDFHTHHPISTRLQ